MTESAMPLIDHYATLKTIHQTAVALSIAGFAARGLASLAGATWVKRRAAKTLPHLVDTVLLVSALALLAALRLSPLEAPWLIAKIAGLLVYIGLGIVALRPGVPRPLRVTAWLGALGTVGWIVSVAVTKSAWGMLSLALS